MKTFVTTLDSFIVVDIPVKCSNFASKEERFFKVEILESSTATEGVDFEPLEYQYMFPSDSYETTIPIKLLETNNLKDSTMVLSLKLIPSDDFNLGEKLRQEVNIVFSDKLEKPSNWDNYSWRYKDYSRVKLEILLMLAEIEEFPSNEEISENFEFYYYVLPRALSNYFRENYPVYDENENIIEPW